MDNIQKAFNQVGKNFYAPNSGGCGLFAYAMSRALDSFGIDNTIMVCCWDEGQLYDFEYKYGKLYDDCTGHYIQYMNKPKGVTIHNHIVVKVGSKYYDTDGEYDTSECVWVGEIQIGTLKRLLDVPCWNNRFWGNNEERQIKYVPTKAIRAVKKLVA